ncbi:hypothetical protein [Streptomyces brasiliensis]|uniref:Uncharacterized protein n=1 Tax=Streptomyces brasiliensis TaxID=1954 RepID=A0A917L484_9ACTN|nr:hypothetical protein [Streptomyces brasiliensis]GGJ42293.1 hypothetical protein GCM10010121_061750 [Streptomyces brasiliensis]
MQQDPVLAIGGAWFLIEGLILTFNPLGLAEKYVKFTKRLGGPRITVSERYLARRLGTVFAPVGCGMLVVWVLPTLGVDKSALAPLIPLAGLCLFVLVGSTIYLIYRASSRGDEQRLGSRP